MKYEHYTPEAVILANGEYPSHPLPLQMLENAEFVVCCDGAANEYILRGHTPDVIIGDGDSLSPEYKELFSPIVHQIADQETNDQTKAVHFLQKKGFRRIAIVGATGAVGVEMIRCLEERAFPVASLTLLASARSAGKKLKSRYWVKSIWAAYLSSLIFS